MTSFSYQLYSSRNFPPLSDTLSMLANAGYGQVEGYGALFGDDTDLSQMRDELDAAGLRMTTAHIGVDLLEENPARAVEIAKTLGVEAVFGPYLQAEDRPTTPEGWVAFGKKLGELCKPLLNEGIEFGWHNHDFEFVAVDGQLPQELLISASDDIKVEFDVAWCVKAGADPVNWIESNADRIISAHIKDIAAPGEAQDEDGWADVGHGTMDWAAIMAALRKTPCRYFIAEHDNPSDHKRFATRSIAAMQTF